MNRLMAVLMAFGLIFSLCACGVQPAEETVPTEEQIVTEAPTEAATEPLPEGLVDYEEAMARKQYNVTVIDENDSPVAGATVQLNSEDADPCITDEMGVAAFSLDEGEYKATVTELPLGYDYATEAREFAFEPGTYFLTIVVLQSMPDPEESDLIEEEVPIEDIVVEDIYIPEG